MDIAMIGLGRMGANMAERLVRSGHRVYGFDPGAPARDQAGRARRRGGRFPRRRLVAALPAPRALWLMVPAGDRSTHASTNCCRLLRAGDIDRRRRQFALQGLDAARGSAWRERGIAYVDCGTSGGVWGLAEGYSLMIGGDEAAVEAPAADLRALAPAPDRGWGAGRARRRRPLRQDGPQRHRIRNDAGLRGRLRHPAAQARVRASTWRRSPRSGATAAWCVRGCSTSPPMRSKKNPHARRHRAVRRRLRRRSLDRRRGDRPRRVGAGDHPVAARTAALARQRLLRRQAAGGDAQRVRRTCSEARRATRSGVDADRRTRRHQSPDLLDLGIGHRDAIHRHPRRSVIKCTNHTICVQW